MKNARTKYARCTWVSLCMPFYSFIIQILTVHQFGALGMIGGPSIAKPSYVAFIL
jgi:hypothetical protein